MRAAYVERTGPAESIRIGELPVPVCGPTDVLVAVEVAAVNPVDTMVRGGRYASPLPFPFVVGRDIVGTVAAAGEWTGFAVGDRVWCNSLGHGGRQGGTAEYAAVPAARLYPLPDGADPTRAVAALHPTATAHLALFHHGHAHAGQTILVGGAAGNVGAAAVQLAAEAGCRVVATARPADADRCRRLGAATVVDYAAPDVEEQIRALAPSGVDLHWDTSGHNDLAAAVRLVAGGGRIVISAHLGAAPTRPVPVRDLYTRDVTIAGFVISRATVPQLADVARSINRHLASADLDVRVTDVLPLEETAAAHAQVERGAPGRLVIEVSGGVPERAPR